jgi:SAM-dependent methyltransferase
VGYAGERYNRTGKATIMGHLSILPAIVRETFGRGQLVREPEPKLMTDRQQVIRYAEEGRIDGVLGGMHLFHSARICQVIHGCERVIDLGCGPARQLVQVAELNPVTSFVGIDLSAEMLANAESYVRKRGVVKVEFVRDDITRLDTFADDSVDGVISNSALHHVQTEDDLRQCFAQISRVLRPGGALYLSDFTLLRSRRSLDGIVSLVRNHAPQLLVKDYELSLMAAFSKEVLRSAAGELLPPGTACYTTFKLPIMAVVQSPDRTLARTTVRRLKELRSGLSRLTRRDLFLLRLLFRLGGRRNIKKA